MADHINAPLSQRLTKILESLLHEDLSPAIGLAFLQAMADDGLVVVDARSSIAALQEAGHA